MLGAEKARSSRMCGQLSSVHLYCKITVPQQSWTSAGTRSKEYIHWHPLHQVTPALLISHSFSELIYSYRAKALCNTETTNDNLTTSLYYLLSPTFSLNLCTVLYAKCPFSFLKLRAQMLILNFFKNSEIVKWPFLVSKIRWLLNDIILFKSQCIGNPI